MIIKAKHTIIPAFKLYTLWKLRSRFRNVRIIGEFKDRDLPVLLISNHISWWDGFWVMYLNMKVLKRKFHFMMLESQLRIHRISNHCGGYSVNKKAKSIIESLKYTCELLNNPKNLTLIFPQGEIQSLHNQHFEFGNGVEWILKDRGGKVQILFIANLVDYFSSPKPSVNIYIKEYEDLIYTTENLQNQYNVFYKNCVENQKTLTD